MSRICEHQASIGRRGGRKSRRTLTSDLPAFTFAMLLAGGTSPVLSQTIRDSAGVRIVDNAAPLWTAAQALRLSPRPVLTIGDRPGAPYELGRIVGAARLRGGQIVVADGGSLQLRFFDSTGMFVKAAAGRGDGPGEVRAMTRLEVLAGDTIAVDAEQFVSIFAHDGTFIRRASPRGTDGPPGPRVTLAVLDGGTLLVGLINLDMPSKARGTRWIDSVALAIVRSDGSTVRALGKFPAGAVEMGEHPRAVFLGPVPVITGGGSSFLFAFGNEYAIREYSAEGRLVRIIRRRWSPKPITARDLDTYVDGWMKQWSRATGAAYDREREEFRRSGAFDRTTSAFEQVIRDRIGRIWVRETNLADIPIPAGPRMPQVPSVWSVFDQQGRWLGDVTMPRRFLPREIGADYVLGVSRDEDDVDTVVMYRLGR